MILPLFSVLSLLYNIPMKQVLQEILTQVVKTEFGLDLNAIKGVVWSHPPKIEMGDYACNVALVLSKELKKSPRDIAEGLALSVERLADSRIQKVESVGGFLNFTLNCGEWATSVIHTVGRGSLAYGHTKVVEPKKILVEYLSPNTNKPLHLGHLRNGILANAIINLAEALGHNVVKVGIVNDRGIHICKAMLAYKLFGNNQTPEIVGTKPDHFVGEWYVRFAKEAEKDPSLTDKAQEMLQKWEAGDAETLELWQKMRSWVLKGWKETEVNLGFSYDKAYFESDVYTLGKDIVSTGLEKGVFRKTPEGHTVFDLSVEEFGTDENGDHRLINVQRSDGTSLYTTQDLGLAVSRAKEWQIDSLIYVVGSEQRFHFQALFAMLKALGYEWAKDLHHLWYGMVYLPEGKMKSREGTVVDADDLLSQMQALAKEEIETRAKELVTDLEIRAKRIALAGIKFFFLRQKATTDMHFDPKESISFEGFTGPYCLYTYARAKSILRISNFKDQISNLKTSPKGEMTEEEEELETFGLISPEERVLVRQLEEFPEIVKRSAEEYNPAVIATFVFETCQAFNTFYTKHQVLKAENEQIKNARLHLVSACAQVIQNGLALLGIETVKEM